MSQKTTVIVRIGDTKRKRKASKRQKKQSGGGSSSSMEFSSSRIPPIIYQPANIYNTFPAGNSLAEQVRIPTEALSPQVSAGVLSGISNVERGLNPPSMPMQNMSLSQKVVSNNNETNEFGTGFSDKDMLRPLPAAIPKGRSLSTNALIRIEKEKAAIGAFKSAMPKPPSRDISAGSAISAVSAGSAMGGGGGRSVEPQFVKERKTRTERGVQSGDIWNPDNPQFFGYTDGGMLRKRATRPQEIQIANYKLQQMKDQANATSRLSQPNMRV